VREMKEVREVGKIKKDEELTLPLLLGVGFLVAKPSH